MKSKVGLIFFDFNPLLSINYLIAASASAEGKWPIFQDNYYDLEQKVVGSWGIDCFGILFAIRHHTVMLFWQVNPSIYKFHDVIQHFDWRGDRPLVVPTTPLVIPITYYFNFIFSSLDWILSILKGKNLNSHYGKTSWLISKPKSDLIIS